MYVYILFDLQLMRTGIQELQPSFKVFQANTRLAPFQALLNVLLGIEHREYQGVTFDDQLNFNHGALLKADAMLESIFHKWNEQHGGDQDVLSFTLDIELDDKVIFFR